jgi:hypothetical protein
MLANRAREQFPQHKDKSDEELANAWIKFKASKEP